MPYATLYLKSLRERDQHFQILKNNSLKAEIYFEYGWKDRSLKEHRELAAIINGELPGCGVHLPYLGLLASDPDPDGQIRATLARAAETAQAYQPDHLIAHVEYNGLTDSIEKNKVFGFKSELTGAPQIPSAEFLDNSVKSWTGVLDSSDSRLFLENTYEHSPFPIMELLNLLPSDRAGFCLDIGHWNHYAMGRHWHNMPLWLEMIKERLYHLHVHDNDGSADQHLALGAGQIDIVGFFALLSERKLTPGFTLENHRAPWLTESLDYLRENRIYPAE